MSDQSTPGPDPSHPEQPAAVDQTAALPPYRGAEGAADTAALPPQQPAPATSVPAPPGWVPAAAPAPAAPSGPRHWWNEATSTGGGRAALAAVAVLAALFVVVGLGLTTALVVSHARGGDDRGFMGNARGDDRFEQGPGMGMGRGNGNGNGKNGNGKGQGNGRQQAPSQANPMVPGNPGNPGMGMGRGAAGAMGAVLHGEFTTNLTGTPTVMVVQTGQVTAYTAGKSLTVKSTDGFEATYTLTGTAPLTARNGATLATGVQAQVLAAKDGMKVTA
ncbi:MAG TPA: hypothetical protein VFL10_07045, partial [Ornithinibacter sp.]|nr:hypothetical protein [Ornithinibacter sp.]